MQTFYAYKSVRQIAVIAAMVCTTPLWAEVDSLDPRVSQFAAGIVCAPPVAYERPSPGSITGTTGVFERDITFTSTSRQVPAVIGIAFGLRLTVKDRGMDPIEVHITHPPMGPSGITEQSFTTGLVADVSRSSLFAFEEDWELVEGPWTISGRYEGEVIYHLNFDVVDPLLVPSLANICGYSDLFS